MESSAKLDKLYEVANYLMTERGYCVIGTVWTRHDVGDITTILWNVEIEQPVRIIAETTRDDWDEQERLVRSKFRSFYTVERGANGKPGSRNYYRVISD